MTFHKTQLLLQKSHLSLVSTSLPLFSSTNAVCLTTGPQPLPKPALHRLRSSTSSFKSQYLLVSLSSHSSCLRLLPRLQVTSTFPSITCLESSSYARSAQSSWRPSLVLLHAGPSSPPGLYAILVHFSHVRSNWSSAFFSITTFQNFPGNSDLLTGATQFQHHIKLTLLVSSLNFSQICW
jgi:hypothetical protein